MPQQKILKSMAQHATKALKALGAYKTDAFGHHSSIWMALNNTLDRKRPNAFRHVIDAARSIPPGMRSSNSPKLVGAQARSAQAKRRNQMPTTKKAAGKKQTGSGNKARSSGTKKKTAAKK